MNRVDTGRPVPSPQVNLTPLAVVNVIAPRRMNWFRKRRNNRSIEAPMERATIILNTEHTLERSVPGMVNSNISMMVPWNYSLGVKADIQKCHTHADAYRVRFHSRH